MVIMEHCAEQRPDMGGLRAGRKSGGRRSEIGIEELAEMLAAVTGIQRREKDLWQGAQVGDKTLIDAGSGCRQPYRNAEAEKNRLPP